MRDHIALATSGDSLPVFAVRGLKVVLGGRRVLGPIDLEVERGSFLGILGPNGSGKTTLLRALSGAVKPSAGEIVLERRRPHDYRAVELARLLGVVPQQFSLDFNFTVAEMVAMGRYPHGGRGMTGPTAGGRARMRTADEVAVTEALAVTGLTALGDRLVTELSGGERQRALIAQTLAQETPTLLLDEPLNNLDMNHQLEIMQLLGRLHGDGRTIAVVLHDLNMAAQFCDELVLLDRGGLAARGEPADIFDPKIILEVFKVHVAVHRQGQRPYLTPLWSGSRGAPPERSRAHVHVIAGGEAASQLLEDLVGRGFSPTVGIVSVFDTDYATAQRYELEVVSSPPFQPFTEEAVRQLQALSARAETIIVAPIFLGQGNINSLRVALEAARQGKKVVLINSPPIGERDLSGGQATALTADLLAAGAVEFPDAVKAVDYLS